MIHHRRRLGLCMGSVLVGVFVVGLGIWSTARASGVEFPGPKPGPATARLDADQLLLETGAIAATWSLTDGRPRLVEATNRIVGTKLSESGPEAFVIGLADGTSLRASQFHTAGKPVLARVPARAEAVRASGRSAGWRASVPMVSEAAGLRVVWHASVRDGSNAIEQALLIAALNREVPVASVTLLDIEVPGAKVVGSVDGSPVASESFFLACEHPMAANRAEEGSVLCGVPRYAPLRPGETWTVTAVIGVYPPGQLRRAFLYYVERERARPYRPFFYYISWFDIAYNDRKMDEQQCLGVIEQFGREMVSRRGVSLDAFVFDDGWDDNRTLWGFHPGFPNGFTRVSAAAARFQATLGVWISPWGGYSTAKAERLRYGETQGFETNPRGFALGGPNYYSRFRDVCVEMIQKYGVGYLKFDGVGQGSFSKGAGDQFGPDIEAFLKLLADLRRAEPNLFVNATVGTWPSPYWLWSSDVVWRGGADLGYHGEGTTRQQWMTYRDMLGCRIHAERGPLFPLNSLKFQSLFFAQLGIATKLSADPNDVIDDLRMAAGSGTQLQEFFVTSRMMTPRLWDAVAEAVGWSRSNADVLVDSHAIGGDPGKGEPYGFASWSPRKGIVVLRNPGIGAAAIEVDLDRAFELPRDAPRRYRLSYPWEHPNSAELPSKPVAAGKKLSFELAPFEVKVFEALPDY